MLLLLIHCKLISSHFKFRREELRGTQTPVFPTRGYVGALWPALGLRLPRPRQQVPRGLGRKDAPTEAPSDRLNRSPGVWLSPLFTFPLSPQLRFYWAGVLLWILEVFLSLTSITAHQKMSTQVWVWILLLTVALFFFFLFKQGDYFQSIDSYYMKSQNLGRVLGTFQLLPSISWHAG